MRRGNVKFWETLIRSQVRVMGFSNVLFGGKHGVSPSCEINDNMVMLGRNIPDIDGNNRPPRGVRVYGENSRVSPSYWLVYRTVFL